MSNQPPNRMPGQPPNQTWTKVRILARNLADMAVDIFVPTIVYLVLRPLGVPLVLAVSTGGMLVAAKAGVGKVGGDADAGRPRLTGKDWLLFGNTVLSIALMFLLHGLGVSLVIAVVAGAVLQALGVATVVLSRGKIDGFALLVLVELGLSVVLAFVSSNDPRFFAVRPVFYILVGAVAVALTCFRGRPAMYTVSRPMAVAGDPHRAVAYDRSWDNSAAFRRMMRGATIALTLVLFVGCALWVYTAFQFTASQFFAANTYSQVPLIVLFVLFFIVFRTVIVPRVSRIVEAEQAKVVAEQAAG
ncbi:MAG TPA: VC0807 family protein [Pseudonocardiaceae bacterium]|nr:VC0807 family protein [Pseudonocardiaceae bacterium]